MAVFAWYWPTLELRLFYDYALDFKWLADPARDLDLSNREDVWKFYFNEWLLSPWFGRGIGSGLIAALGWLDLLQIRPHNQYLHLLMTTGAVGFVLVAAAIGIWYRQLVQRAYALDRPFLLALALPLAALAVTEDVLLFSTALGLFAYFGVVLTRPPQALIEALQREEALERELALAEASLDREAPPTRLLT
jgi:O-antigen ligase